MCTEFILGARLMVGSCKLEVYDLIWDFEYLLLLLLRNVCVSFYLFNLRWLPNSQYGIVAVIKLCVSMNTEFD